MPTVAVWLNEGDYVRIAELAKKDGENVARWVQDAALEVLHTVGPKKMKA